MASAEWIILLTDRYTETRAFYADVLGFVIEREVPEDEFIQFRLDNLRLALYGRAGFERTVGRQERHAGGMILTLSITGTVMDSYHSLKAKGVPLIHPPEVREWGQRTAYFTDPDGHLWEIQEWIN